MDYPTYLDQSTICCIGVKRIPRTRPGIMALELFDTTPDWERFRTRFENASRKVLRLRQKVVVPTLPTAHRAGWWTPISTWISMFAEYGCPNPARCVRYSISRS